MPRPGLSVGVVFGGRSVEHDVSIITGLQACETLDARHEVVPLYVDREGRWFTGAALRDVESYRREVLGADPVVLDLSTGLLRAAGQAVGAAADPPRRRRRLGLGAAAATGPGSAAEPAPPAETRLDVIIPATHGTLGEDGALQGALELSDLPYAGPSLEAAVLAMNKAVCKSLLRAAGIPVLEDLVLRREQYEREGGAALASRARTRFGLPVYCKPVSLGSSVGVRRCADEAELIEALELCFELDRVAIVEPAVEGGREVNCAVLGRPGAEPRLSVCEQPLASDGLLSFEDKYLRGDSPGEKGGGADKTGGGGDRGVKSAGMGSAQRIIPAPISDELTARVRELAAATFAAIGGCGVTRVDMLIDDSERVFVNEPNTIPGSFAHYLFEPAGLPFADLLDELIDLALAEHAEGRRTTRTFESNLLAMRGRGVKDPETG